MPTSMPTSMPNSMPTSTPESSPEFEARTLRRVTVRLVPLLMALYFVNYLDRTNLGIAKAEVSADLQLSATMFGLASGIFFIGYVLVEVPSNLALVRFGARRWLARIAVSWGLMAMAVGFAPNAMTLLVLRFLLGVAEAGLFPGVVFYLSQWFPAAYRARMVGVFMLAVPIASALGTPLAAWLIQTGDGVAFGLAGWRFMMICVGLPAVILGVVFAGLFAFGDTVRVGGEAFIQILDLRRGYVGGQRVQHRTVCTVVDEGQLRRRRRRRTGRKRGRGKANQAKPDKNHQ